MGNYPNTDNANMSWVEEQGWIIYGRGMLNPTQEGHIPDSTHKALLEKSIKEHAHIWREMARL